MQQAELKAILWYHPESGVFRWRHARKNNSIPPWSIAGWTESQGYIDIQIGKKVYNAHRLAWLYVHGDLPKEIDHINGNRADNRIENLRPADRFVNTQNVSRRSDNTTGFAGVRFYKQTNKYTSEIKHNKKRLHLGYFDTPEAAHKAYINAKQKLHQGYVERG